VILSGIKHKQGESLHRLMGCCVVGLKVGT